MPTCPNCGTWNPDDKVVCWRCQTPLPKQEPRKKSSKRRLFLGMPLWVWGFFLLLLLLNFFLPLILRWVGM
ncbi:MAG: hypothetical protein GXO55_01010 [Chloroflexi bacterium]|nr:hypothetical protein [Chloroflexota bacterium]